MPPKQIVFPGDSDTLADAVEKISTSVKVGPNIFQNAVTPPVPIKAGYLSTKKIKSGTIIYVESSNKRYIPSLGDNVIGIVSARHSEGFRVVLQEYSPPVQLGQFAFQNATKKNKVNLQPGNVVYGRISTADPNVETEMECLNSTTGQADGYGELKGGLTVDVPLGYARMLYYEGGPVLKAVGEHVSFEIAIGLNGKVWVNAEDVLTTWKIAQCIEKGQGWRKSEVAENVSSILASS